MTTFLLLVGLILATKSLTGLGTRGVSVFLITWAYLIVVAIGSALTTGLSMDHTDTIYFVGMAALLVGHMVGRRSRNVSGDADEDHTKIGPTSVAPAMATTRFGTAAEVARAVRPAVITSILFTVYHFAVAGVPILSSRVALARWNTLESGLYGVPARSYQMALPAIVLIIGVARRRLAVQDRQLDLLFLYSGVAFVLSRLLGGFKGGALQVVIVFFFIYGTTPGGLPFWRLIKRFLVPIALAILLTVGAASLYDTVRTRAQASQGTVAEQVLNRATVGAAAPVRLTIQQRLRHKEYLPSNPLAHDLSVYVPRYLPLFNSKGFPFSQHVSALYTGRALGGVAFVVPSTPGLVATLYFGYGIVGLLLCGVIGLLFGLGEKFVRTSASPLRAGLTAVGLFNLHLAITKGSIVYYVLNVALVAALFGVVTMIFVRKNESVPVARWGTRRADEKLRELVSVDAVSGAAAATVLSHLAKAKPTKPQVTRMYATKVNVARATQLAVRQAAANRARRPSLDPRHWHLVMDFAGSTPARALESAAKAAHQQTTASPAVDRRQATSTSKALRLGTKSPIASPPVELTPMGATHAASAGRETKSATKSATASPPSTAFAAATRTGSSTSGQRMTVPPPGPGRNRSKSQSAARWTSTSTVVVQEPPRRRRTAPPPTQAATPTKPAAEIATGVSSGVGGGSQSAEKPSGSGSLKKQASFVFVWRVVASVATFALLAFVSARSKTVLTAAFVFLSAALTATAVACRLGLGRTVNREIAACRSRGDRDGLKSVVRGAFLAQLLLLCAGLPVFCIVLVVSPFPALRTPIMLAVCAGWLVSEVLRALLAEMLRGHGRIAAATMIGEGPRAVISLAPIVVTLISGRAPTVLDLTVWQLVAAGLLAAVGLSIVARSSNGLIGGGGAADVRQALSGTMWAGVVELSNISLYQTGVVVTGFLLTAADTARVGLLFRFAVLFNLPLMVINNVMAPRVASKFAAGRLAEVEPRLRRLSWLAFAIVVAGLGGLGVVGMLWPGGFAHLREQHVLWPLAVVTAGQLVALWCGSCSMVLMMSDGTRAAARRGLHAALGAAILTPILALTMGITGVALAFALMLAWQNVSSTRFIQHHFGISTTASLRGTVFSR